MAASEHYRRQVGLLIRVLPLVAEENVFALKGGTAINLFIRDLPRLSVDVDLTYLPVAGRPESLADIVLASERIGDRLRTAFVIYMLSHNRPMAEVLAPTRKDISREFERGFSGMTEVPVTVDDLVEAREQLLAEIVGNMPQAHKDLLMSFEAGKPDWSLIDVPQAADLPAVRWRQENLDKLDRERREALIDGLRTALP